MNTPTIKDAYNSDNLQKSKCSSWTHIRFDRESKVFFQTYGPFFGEDWDTSDFVCTRTSFESYSEGAKPKMHYTEVDAVLRGQDFSCEEEYYTALERLQEEYEVVYD